MSIEVILCFALIIILFGTLIMSYFGICSSLRKIKDCNDGITRCIENASKNPDDIDWIYMKWNWKHLRTEYVLTIWVISIVIVISLFAITYISCYMLNNFI